MSSSPIAALGRVASLLTREEDTSSLVRAVMEEGQRLFDAQRAGLYLLDDDGNVEDVVTIGLSPAYATALRTRFHDAPAKAQLLRGEPTFVRDATEDTTHPIHQQIVDEGFLGAAALPLCYNGKTIGFLTFYHDQPRDYDDDERILARAFADQAALAIGTRRLVDTVVRVKQEWQTAFDGVGNGLALITPDGEVERANRFFSEMSGKPVTDLPGTQLARLFVDWPAGERDPLRQATSRGHRISLFLDTPSGQHVVLTATPRSDGGFVVAVDDLTHYVRLEARYSRLVETAREAIILAGPDGRVVFANPAAAELFGVPATRLTGDSLASLLPEERASIGTTPSTAGSFSYEALIRRNDGVRIVDVSIAPLEERGTVTGSVAVARDVTKERLAAEALRRSERRFRTLFNRAPLAIFTMDRDGRFIAANRAAFRLAGVTPASLDAKLADFVLPMEWPRIQRELEHSAQGEFRDFMFPFRRTDGSIRQAAAVTVPVEEKGGRRAILTIARDVTDEVELRERLTHSEKMAALGALVSGTAHELNNPLAGIAAMAQALLLERGAGDEIGRALETIRGEAMRAARIVTDLLTFARLRPLDRRDVNLNQVVKDTFAATPGLAAHGVIWTLGLDPTLPSVSADPDQIRQVVTNLLVNASQAVMDLERKEGLVRTWSTADWVGFEVLDSGAGIPAQVLTRIFEPFFTTKTQGQGTGLGLSISHGILRAHGGEIRGENRPEGGARFTFQLPRDPTRIARTTDA